MFYSFQPFFAIKLVKVHKFLLFVFTRSGTFVCSWSRAASFFFGKWAGEADFEGLCFFTCEFFGNVNGCSSFGDFCHDCHCNFVIIAFDKLKDCFLQFRIPGSHEGKLNVCLLWGWWHRNHSRPTNPQKLVHLIGTLWREWACWPQWDCELHVPLAIIDKPAITMWIWCLMPKRTKMATILENSGRVEFQVFFFSIEKFGRFYIAMMTPRTTLRGGF